MFFSSSFLPCLLVVFERSLRRGSPAKLRPVLLSNGNGWANVTVRQWQWLENSDHSAPKKQIRRMEKCVSSPFYNDVKHLAFQLRRRLDKNHHDPCGVAKWCTLISKLWVRPNGSTTFGWFYICYHMYLPGWPFVSCSTNGWFETLVEIP